MQIELSVRRSFISAERARSILATAAEVARMLHGTHRALKARQARLRTAGGTAVLLLLHASGFFVF